MAQGDFSDLWNEALALAVADGSVTADKSAATAAVNEAIGIVQTCTWTQQDTGEDGKPVGGPYEMHFDFSEAQGTFATAIGTSDYTFTTIGTAISATVEDVLTVEAIPGAGTLTLDYLTPDDFERIRVTGNLPNGVPQVWTKLSRSLVRIYPAPVAVGSLRVLVLARPTELTSPTNDAVLTTLPPVWARRVISHYAAARILERDGGMGLGAAQSHMQVYSQALAELKMARGVANPMASRPVDFPAGTVTTGSLLDIARDAVRGVGLQEWDSFQIARAKKLIADIEHEIIGSSDLWDFLEKEGQMFLVAGSDTYSYASIATAIGVDGVGEILNIVVDTDREGEGKLEMMDWPSLEAYVGSTQDGSFGAGGPPVFMAKWEARVRFWPIPDAAYKLGVYCRQRPNKLSADTSVSLIPDTFRAPLLEAYAKWQLELGKPRDKRDPYLANSFKAEYERLFRALQMAHGSEKRPTVRFKAPTYLGDYDVMYG